MLIPPFTFIFVLLRLVNNLVLTWLSKLGAAGTKLRHFDILWSVGPIVSGDRVEPVGETLTSPRHTRQLKLTSWMSVRTGIRAVDDPWLPRNH